MCGGGRSTSGSFHFDLDSVSACVEAGFPLCGNKSLILQYSIDPGHCCGHDHDVTLIFSVKSESGYGLAVCDVVWSGSESWGLCCDDHEQLDQ